MRNISFQKGHGDDLILRSVEIRPGILSRTFAEKTLGQESPNGIPFVLPTVFNHLVAVSDGKTYSCRRDTSLRQPHDYVHSNLNALVPNLRSVIDFDSGHMLTQLSQKTRPKRVDESGSGVIGYMELIDLLGKEVRYLPVSSNTDKNRNEPWRSYVSFSNTNEAEFLFDLSPVKRGCVYTLDFNGTLSAWETSRADLERSLDEWHKLVANKQADGLKIEIFKDSPNKQLREFNGPKHGKVDPNNQPHFGGNQWAGLR